MAETTRTPAYCPPGLRTKLQNEVVERLQSSHRINATEVLRGPGIDLSMLQRSLKIVRRESGSSPKMMAVDVEAPEQSAGKLELLIGQAGGGNIIFDFNIMIPPKTAECADLRGNAEDPLEQISIVGALVQQHPASPAS